MKNGKGILSEFISLTLTKRKDTVGDTSVRMRKLGFKAYESTIGTKETKGLHTGVLGMR